MVNKDLDMAPRPTLERNGIALRLMSLLQFRLSGPIYIYTRSYKGLEFRNPYIGWPVWLLMNVDEKVLGEVFMNPAFVRSSNVGLTNVTADTCSIL